MEIVRTGIATARATQPEAIAKQRPDHRCVGGTAPAQTAAGAQLAGQLIELLEPALGLHAGAVIGRQPQCPLGDIAVARGAFEHCLARLQSLHGR